MSEDSARPAVAPTPTVPSTKPVSTTDARALANESAALTLFVVSSTVLPSALAQTVIIALNLYERILYYNLCWITGFIGGPTAQQGCMRNPVYCQGSNCPVGMNCRSRRCYSTCREGSNTCIGEERQHNRSFVVIGMAPVVILFRDKKTFFRIFLHILSKFSSQYDEKIPAVAAVVLPLAPHIP